MFELISRKEAQLAGSKYFFTAVDCKNGHSAQRFVSDGKCYECKRLSWEKVRRSRGAKPFSANTVRHEAIARGDNKFLGNPCPYDHGGLRWTHNSLCVTCGAASSKRYAKASGYQAVRNWAAKNPDRVSEIKKRHLQTQAGALSSRIQQSRRRSLKRSASGTHSRSDIESILQSQRGCCAWCRQKTSLNYHVDHIQPLSKGGRNDRRNLQILCPPCNLRKWASDPIDFAQREGRLL